MPFGIDLISVRAPFSGLRSDLRSLKAVVTSWNGANGTIEALFYLGIRLKFDPDTLAKGGHPQSREKAHPNTSA
jgi:hypothetical protein